MTVPAKNVSQLEAAQIRIVVYTEEEELYRLREEWDALLQKVSSANIYLTWEWAFACWKIFGRDCRLFLVAAYEGDQLVGLAPLRISRKLGKGVLPYNTLEFIPGSPSLIGGDHLDIMVVPEKRSAIIGVMLHSIIAGSWDVLRWESIPASSPNMGALATAFQKGKITYGLKPASICPYITLPDSWEESLALLPSAKFRRNVRYSIRKLDRDHSTSIVRADSPQDFSYGLKRLENLHEERWGKESIFRQRGFRAFHEEVAKAFSLRGWLRLYLLIVDGEEVAANYAFRYGSTLFGYQVGWKKAWEKYSVGTVLLAKVIQQELAQGAREIDLARGAQAYKFRWTSDFREEVRLTAYCPSWRGRLVHWWRSIISRVRAGL
jgi:CelD/BcsL family acetyltransferase involved in cellulose biosynthesis